MSVIFLRDEQWYKHNRRKSFGLQLSWYRHHHTKSKNNFKKTISNSSLNFHFYWDTLYNKLMAFPRVAVVYLNFRAGSTFPVPVCTVPSSMGRTSWCNKVDTVRLYASHRLNLLLPKGQICLFPFFFFEIINKSFYNFTLFRKVCTTVSLQATSIYPVKPGGLGVLLLISHQQQGSRV